MPNATAATPDAYIDALPEARREALRAVADVIRRNLPAGFEEGMLYGMIAWYVPYETFPNTYNGQPLGLASLASQKPVHQPAHAWIVARDAKPTRTQRSVGRSVGSRMRHGTDPASL